MTGRVLRVVCGDALRLPLPDCSVDAVVTDPPYGLEFMGKEWDRPWAVSPTQRVGFEGREDNLTLPAFGDSRNANCRACGGRQRGAKRCSCAAPQWDRAPRDDMRAYQRWCELWAAECLRVLKPGGHLLAAGGTRTYHRLACAIEDAGFEVRDCIDWIYGSGFPKSLDVSKAIDRAAGAEREVVGERSGGAALKMGGGNPRPWHERQAERGGAYDVTAPATDEARRWAGWGTALKPAHEPIVVARKPLAGTVAGNVLAYGTGGINVDACRVGPGVPVTGGGGWAAHKVEATDGWDRPYVNGVARTEPHALGRWPANVVLTHSEDCQPAGTRKVKGITGGTGNHAGQVYGKRSNVGQPVRDYADADGMETVEAWDCAEDCPVAELDRQSGNRPSGGGDRGTTSRDGLMGRDSDRGRATRYSREADRGGASRFFPVFRYQAKASRAERNLGGVHNDHPTVKPVDLMRWLIRLVTPSGGVVLDPFVGSGSTGIAAVREGVSFVGIDRDPAYVDMAAGRIAAACVVRPVNAARSAQVSEAQGALFE